MSENPTVFAPGTVHKRLSGSEMAVLKPFRTKHPGLGRGADCS